MTPVPRYQRIIPACDMTMLAFTLKCEYPAVRHKPCAHKRTASSVPRWVER